MRALLYILTASVVIGLAFWAYTENYKTQAVLEDTEKLEREIGKARERLAVLNAEWAYLNRPERLRDLAELNFETLGLIPFGAAHFGRVDQIAYPLPPTPIFDLSAPIDLTSRRAQP